PLLSAPFPYTTLFRSAALSVQATDDLGRPPAHRLDGGAAVACLAQRSDVDACRGRDLILRHLSFGERLEHAGVDEYDVDALFPQDRKSTRLHSSHVSL